MEVLGGLLGQRWRERGNEEVRGTLPLCPSGLDVESVWEGAWGSCVALERMDPVPLPRSVAI